MDEHEAPSAQDILHENAIRLAESTEVSEDRARELLERYGGDYELAKREARDVKPGS
jgi:hypothetical protein